MPRTWADDYGGGRKTAQPVFRGTRVKSLCHSERSGGISCFSRLDRKSTRLNSSHTVIHSSLHDALPIWAAEMCLTKMRCVTISERSLRCRTKRSYAQDMGR